jgi:hypothetical protein
MDPYTGSHRAGFLRHVTLHDAFADSAIKDPWVPNQKPALDFLSHVLDPH